MGKFYSTKTYEHLGSTAFRQWKAHSHCKYVHGYSFTIKFVFSADELDHQNFVVDFGGLKPLKAVLEDTLDHKTLVAEDDPELMWFRTAEERGILQLVVVEASGCERMAELIYNVAEQWLEDAGFSPRATLESVEVQEHGANSAVYGRVTDV